MATRIDPDGTERTVTPKNGMSFTLDELYEHTGAETVEVIGLTDGRLMWLDEEGKLKDGLKLNQTATKLLKEAWGIPGDFVVGAVLLTTRFEGGAEDDWVERHSINCYGCGELTDERECVPNSAEFGGNDDGGDLCAKCVTERRRGNG